MKPDADSHSGRCTHGPTCDSTEGTVSRGQRYGDNHSQQVTHRTTTDVCGSESKLDSGVHP